MELNREVVTFRDGTELTVTEATWGSTLMLQELEEQARVDPLPDPKDNAFQAAIWPKLRACSSGTVPSFEEALMMPATELDKWYNAAKQVNPDWFLALDAIADLAATQAEIDEALVAKKEPTPTKSSQG